MLTVELNTIGQTKINTLIPSVLFVVLDFGFMFYVFFLGLSQKVNEYSKSIGIFRGTSYQVGRCRKTWFLVTCFVFCNSINSFREREREMQGLIT